MSWGIWMCPSTNSRIRCPGSAEPEQDACSGGGCSFLCWCRTSLLGLCARRRLPSASGNVDWQWSHGNSMFVAAVYVDFKSLFICFPIENMGWFHHVPHAVFLVPSDWSFPSFCALLSLDAHLPSWLQDIAPLAASLTIGKAAALGILLQCALPMDVHMI